MQMCFREQRRNTLHKHPIVTAVSDERGNDDGICCSLEPGYKAVDGDHQVREDTVALCREKLAGLTPCDCDACKREVAEQAKKSK